MNTLQLSPLSQNPFWEVGFWGRQKELTVISRYLVSTVPRCCAIIGEDTFGKTSLLQHLSSGQETQAVESSELNSVLIQLKKQFVFVYLNCAGYANEVADMQNLASARFWWDLYDAARQALKGEASPLLTKPKIHADQEYIDTALEIMWELEDLIQRQLCKVVFVLDNFEGVARLPLRDSEWLRSLAKVCTYVVSSRDLLYLLYHTSNWSTPSPLWNLFGDPIYLNLPPDEEVDLFLSQARDKARAENSVWKASDIDYIRKAAGRHPALLRFACAAMFEYRLQENPIVAGKYSYKEQSQLDYTIDKSAGSTCMLLWQGLARPELKGEPRTSLQQDATAPLSLHQRAFLEVAKGAASSKDALPLRELDSAANQKVLLDLEQHGLIEYKGAWCVFSEIMRRFILKQEPALLIHTDISQNFSSWHREIPGLTHQEKKVYDYLKAHKGEVCSREDMKWAIWQGKEPTNSALQKIVERVRAKIEPDVDHPRYLIAIRGKGYILRDD